MSATVIVGLQWGDEGKGKIIDYLSRDVPMVVRYQGGANAGHTVWVGSQKYVLHTIPSGVLRPGVAGVVGNGVVVDPAGFLDEIDYLRRLGIDVEGRLHLSDRAHVVMPYHKRIDVLREGAAGKHKIGTTGRGIGPCYADKMRRVGMRFADLIDDARREDLARANLTAANRQLVDIHGVEALPMDETLATLAEHAGRIRPYVADTVRLVHDALDRGEPVLFEGAQGCLLDVDFGTYPYVTASNTTPFGVGTGAGIPFGRIDRVLGILKAYTTRVGEGPMPTELTGKDGERLRGAGAEFGATTGRPRRCGWLDLVAARYACRTFGIREIALTKLDVLDRMDELPVCTAYRRDGGEQAGFPASVSALQAAEPVLETLPGWKQPTGGAGRWEQLPANARRYVEFIEEQLGARIVLVSVGVERTQVIAR